VKGNKKQETTLQAWHVDNSRLTLPGQPCCSALTLRNACQIKCSINVAVWTPEGRRCLTGTQSGEFTLWNGSQFNFETILQARLALPPPSSLPARHPWNALFWLSRA